MEEIEENRDVTPQGKQQHCQVTIVMAYSDDYSIGRLCESVNRAYASRYGHPFVSHVSPAEDILRIIHPKKHVTWYKIFLLRNLMRQALSDMGYSEEELLNIENGAHRFKDKRCDEEGPPRGESKIADREESSISLEETNQRPLPVMCGSENQQPLQYLFWVDGDAMFVHHDLSMDEFLEEAQYKDLIIAEDMHKLNPINAGVFLLRVCPWSLEFLESTWINQRYDATYYYEQSAMIKAIRNRKQGLYYIRPFHSFDGGPQDVKLFPNLAIFPLALFSSNNLMSAEESEIIVREYENNCCLNKKEGRSSSSVTKPSETESKDKIVANTVSEYHSCEENDTRKRPLFIFHAAGMRSKLNILKAVIIKYKLPCSLVGGEEWIDMSFHLARNNLGHVISYHYHGKPDQFIIEGRDQTTDMTLGT
jgi:hypothetical protein